MKTTIAFIGAGNMTRSLVAGLSHTENNYHLKISDPQQDQLNAIKSDAPHIETFTNNRDAIIGSDIVVLAVKPQMMKEVCESIIPAVKSEKPLIISIAAGITTQNIIQWLAEEHTPIVRCMPNTPSLVQSGMTGLFANEKVTEQQSINAESILKTVGSTLWLNKEEALDAVTAVSGSGPAYYFLVMESMQKAAQELGLTAEEARLLVLQTAFGAAKLAIESTDSTETLRERVTSKGGTTEAALNKLIGGGLPFLFEEAIVAAAIRSKELSQL